MVDRRPVSYTHLDVYKRQLQNNPNDAEASLWAGTVIAKQRKLEKQSAALFQIARAAYFDGQGALPPATRTPLQAYLEKTYINFHGSRDGLDQVVEAAKKSALPPADFKIESKNEILAKQEEEPDGHGDHWPSHLGLDRHAARPE